MRAFNRVFRAFGRPHGWAALALALLAAGALGRDAAAQAAGQWSTSEGAMTLNQSGPQVNGRYDQDNGEIVGLMRGNTLEGYWSEDGSAQRCSSPVNGRYHWGRIRFVFSGGGFRGEWGYCDSAFSGNWTGERSGRAGGSHGGSRGASVAGRWSTSEGAMTLNQSGPQVNGRYDQDNGVFVGVMQGTALDGYWVELCSAEGCPRPMNGRYHWGRIRFVCSGGRFRGEWGYCNSAFSGGWTGQR